MFFRRIVRVSQLKFDQSVSAILPSARMRSKKGVPGKGVTMCRARVSIFERR